MYCVKLTNTTECKLRQNTHKPHYTSRLPNTCELIIIINKQFHFSLHFNFFSRCFFFFFFPFLFLKTIQPRRCVCFCVYTVFIHVAARGQQHRLPYQKFLFLTMCVSIGCVWSRAYLHRIVADAGTQFKFKRDRSLMCESFNTYQTRNSLRLEI